MSSEKFADVVQARRSFEEFATNDKFIDQDYYPGDEGVTIKDYHEEWVDALEEQDRIALTAFTGSGKTTIPGVLYPLWKIFTEPGFDILVVSATMQQSTKILSEIKHHIENSEYLSDLKPEKRSANWSRTEIETTSGSRIYCKPFSEGVKGVHVDLVICDEAAEFKDHELFSRYVQTRAEAKDGTICLISTPVHENDLMAKMSDGTRTPRCPECADKLDKDDEDNYFCEEHGVFSLDEADYNPMVSSKGYWSKTYPVYREVDEESELSFEVNDKLVEPLFPETFDERRIRELREEDMTMFQKEYLCEPLAVEGDLFDPNDILSLYDKEMDFHQNPNPDDDYYMGCDFAVSKQGDYSVYTVLEVPADGSEPVLCYMERIRGRGLPWQENRIKELNDIFQFRKVIVDETNFGRSIFENLKLNSSVPVEGQSFEMKARNNLIVGLKNRIESGNLVIPRGGERAKKLTDKLYDELLGFGTSETQSGSISYQSTAKHDDTVMSLAMVSSMVKRKKPVMSAIAHG